MNQLSKEEFKEMFEINERKEFEKFMYGEVGHDLNSKLNSAEMSANYFAWQIWQARAELNKLQPYKFEVVDLIPD